MLVPDAPPQAEPTRAMGGKRRSEGAMSHKRGAIRWSACKQQHKHVEFGVRGSAYSGAVRGSRELVQVRSLPATSCPHALHGALLFARSSARFARSCRGQWLTQWMHSGRRVRMCNERAGVELLCSVRLCLQQCAPLGWRLQLKCDSGSRVQSASGSCS